MITVVGSINLDLIADVGRLPGPGETVAGDGFKTAPGGKGANQALAAARAGAKVRMIGSVGKTRRLDALAGLKEGRRLSCVREPSGERNRLTCRRKGRKLIAVGGGQDTVWRRSQPRGLPKGEISLANGIQPQVRRRWRRAQGGGGLDPNTAPSMRRPTPPEMRRCRGNETNSIFTARRCLYPAVTGRRAARLSRKKTGRTIIVTLGGDGAWAALRRRVTVPR